MKEKNQLRINSFETSIIKEKEPNNFKLCSFCINIKKHGARLIKNKTRIQEQ